MKDRTWIQLMLRQHPNWAILQIAEEGEICLEQRATPDNRVVHLVEEQFSKAIPSSVGLHLEV